MFGIHVERGWTLVNSILRVCQIVGAIVVLIYYATPLNNAVKEHKYTDGKFVYATVVGSASLTTALALLFMPWLNQTRANSVLFLWEIILFILWTALMITFRHFFSEKAEMDDGIEKMKVAVGFDAACSILWAMTAARSTYVFILNIMKPGMFNVGRLKHEQADGTTPATGAKPPFY